MLVASPGLKRERGQPRDIPMKAKDVKQGGYYQAKVSDQLVTVQVDEIVAGTAWKGGKRVDATYYKVTNLRTGKRLVFRSAMKLRKEMPQVAPNGTKEGRKLLTPSKPEAGEQRPDPTTPSVHSTSGMTPTTPVATPKPSLAASVLGKIMVKRAEADAADTAPHVVVKARAGTGKTTTIEHAIRLFRGVGSPLTPTDQQKAIWDQVMLSRGHARSVGVVAFNTIIADEMKRRLKSGTPEALADAMTAHSLGMKAIRQRFRLRPGDDAVSDYHIEDIAGELLDKDSRTLKKQFPVLVNATVKLVELAKLTLADATSHIQLDRLARQFDVDLVDEKGEDYSEAVYDLVHPVMEASKDVTKYGRISHADMVWLPLVLDLPVTRYDLLFIDEAQDLSRCIQELVKKAGKRLVYVGDDKQAIYAFAGADAESFHRIKGDLAGTTRGVVELPLTKTRRCGHAIVAEARTLVDDFEAFEGNTEGEVIRVRFNPTPHGQPDWRGMAKIGDMVLCRTNAPLVGEVFKLIRRGIPANIQGRNIAKDLKGNVKTLSGDNPSMPVAEFVQALEDYYRNAVNAERARRNPSEAKLIALSDRYECLLAFCEQATTAGQVSDKIGSVFTNDRDASKMVMFSSIHRAKGLEADNVYLLEPEGAGIPHPMAKTPQAKEQEFNLKYVAITRAIKRLVYVS